VDRAVSGALAEVGLAGFERRGLDRVSKGERQRVGLASALLGDPDVLLLDEPTSGLDPAQLVAIRALVGRQRGRRTVLFSTHLLPEVTGTCDRVVVLHRGRVVATGGADGRLDGEAAVERVRLEVDGPTEAVASAVRAVPGIAAVQVDGDGPDGARRLRATVAPGVDARSSLARAIVEGGWGLRELRRETPGLEETFLRLVAGEEAR
jgi:ABC-2 type transport system ATP-binding protein